MIRDGVPLAPFTTLELGGPARHFVEAADEGDGRRGAALGGRPRVAGAAPGRRFEPGRRRRGLRRPGRPRSPRAGVRVRDVGGEATRHRRGRRAVGRAGRRDRRRAGSAALECLSGIPGLVGATPIQNVGAYGQEVAETIRAVRVLERGAGGRASSRPRRAGSAIATAPSSASPDRFVVLARDLRAAPRRPRPPCATGELAEALAGAGRRPPTLADARAAVLALRPEKSMLLDRRTIPTGAASARSS